MVDESYTLLIKAGVGLTIVVDQVPKLPGVHFANARRIGDLMWPLIHEYKPEVVVIDCSAIPDLEYTAFKMLTDAEKKLRQSRISLWLAALNPEPVQLVQKTELGKTLGHQRMQFNLEQAVRSFQGQSASATQERMS